MVDGGEASVLITRWPLGTNEVTQLTRSLPREAKRKTFVEFGSSGRPQLDECICPTKLHAE